MKKTYSDCTVSNKKKILTYMIDMSDFRVFEHLSRTPAAVEKEVVQVLCVGFNFAKVAQ